MITLLLFTLSSILLLGGNIAISSHCRKNYKYYSQFFLSSGKTLKQTNHFLLETKEQLETMQKNCETDKALLELNKKALKVLSIKNTELEEQNKKLTEDFNILKGNFSQLSTTTKNKRANDLVNNRSLFLRPTVDSALSLPLIEINPNKIAILKRIISGSFYFKGNTYNFSEKDFIDYFSTDRISYLLYLYFTSYNKSPILLFKEIKGKVNDNKNTESKFILALYQLTNGEGIGDITSSSITKNVSKYIDIYEE